ncbi:MAG: acetolactate synthase small subunit [Rhizobiales bacterium]|nr:acetolactate synthase small subunit [Hyphomicrobiales bacterium]
MTNDKHTLSILVDNEAGVLARVIGLFSARGFNIESLTVSEIDKSSHVSCITIVTTATDNVITQIKLQLLRLVPVHSVVDLTLGPPHVEREMALIKVASVGQKRVEALRLADAFRAHTIDAAVDSFIFEITGSQDKVNQFIKLMIPLGLVEISRTGIAAISRGSEAVHDLED